MPLITDGGTYRSVACSHVENQIGLNIRFWHADIIVPGDYEAADVVAAMDTDLAPLMKNWLSETAAWRGMSLQQILPVLLDPGISVLNAGTGAAGIGMEGGQISGCLTLKTPFAGRRNRGRAYLPFPGDTNTAPPNALTGAGRTAMSAIGEFYSSVFEYQVSSIVVLKMTPVIWHADSGTEGAVINAYRTNDKLATQRRRGSYGRPNANPF